MDQKLSKSIALRLLAALSAADVDAVIKNDEDARYWFDNPQNWQPYGGRPKNWDTVGNQQTNPVGALVELVTNGIDAILMRKAREAIIVDFRSPEAPQTMFEAVKRFFPHIVEGKIANLEPAERTALAQQCVIIGIKRADRINSRYPTYTIVDFGDGQIPEDFPKTFLSLSEKNKEGIPFVQGKFNMGSTGSLRFCTCSDIRLGHYKLLVSRHPGHEYWGWTLVRVRGPRQGEALPVAEYFAPYGQIQRFKTDTLSAFNHDALGIVSEGSIVRLYEFDVGQRAYQVDFGLYDALTVNLIDCALPVQLYDFDAKPVKSKGKLREEGIAPRTFGGLSAVLRAEANETVGDEAEQSLKGTTEFVHLVLEDKHEELGHIKVIATAVSKLKEFLQSQPARVFYTVNGQTHAIERASFFNTRVGLGDLRNHVLVNVVCDGMDLRALAAIFMPDRERKANNELARMLEDLVIRALKEDGRLRAYAAEIRRRRATEHVEDSAEQKDFLTELVKIDPAIQDLFGLGTFLPEITQKPGGEKPFLGKKFPTFLDPLNLRQENGRFVKEVPVNATRRIECGTDAVNEYLTRVDSPGATWSSLPPADMPHSVRLRNGTATFTLRTPKTAKPGDELIAEFGFIDVGLNLDPLKFTVLVRFTPEEPPKTGKPSGRTKDTKEQQSPSLAMPRFEWVAEADWTDHDFTEDSGSYVSTGETTIVYVNRDNKYLRAMKMKEKDEAARMLNEHMFRFGLGLLALSIHRKALTRDENMAESVVRLATEAMSAHIVTVIRRLGGSGEA